MQKTADEMRISDWSSDVCSSDLGRGPRPVALAVIDEAKLIPGKGIFVVARDGQLQDAPRLFEVRGIFGCDQRMAEHGGDHRLVAGSLNRLPERWKGLTRLARFKQDLALQLQKIGVVRIGGDQRDRKSTRLNSSQ